MAKLFKYNIRTVGRNKEREKIRKSEKQRGARKIYFEDKDANMRKLSEL